MFPRFDDFADSNVDDGNIDILFCRRRCTCISSSSSSTSSFRCTAACLRRLCRRFLRRFLPPSSRSLLISSPPPRDRPTVATRLAGDVLLLPFRSSFSPTSTLAFSLRFRSSATSSLRIQRRKVNSALSARRRHALHPFTPSHETLLLLQLSTSHHLFHFFSDQSERHDIGDCHPIVRRDDAISSSSVRSDSLKPVRNRPSGRSRNTSCSRRRANRRWRGFLPHSCLINSAPSPRTSPRTPARDPFERLGGAGAGAIAEAARRDFFVVVDTHTSSSLPVTFKIEHRSWTATPRELTRNTRSKETT